MSMPSDPETARAINLLKDVLVETHATVRSFGTKAQIISVGYIFALGVIGQMSDMLGRTSTSTPASVVVFWVIIILPTIFFGFVLYPTHKTAIDSEDIEYHGIRQVLYLDPAKRNAVDDVREAALVTDPLREYSYELLVMSSLRETKRVRFLRVLFAAALAFGVMFTEQLLRVL